MQIHNKNSDIFRQGAKLVLEENNTNGIYGIVYDDFNPNMEIVNSWKKEYPEMKIFYVATRGKSILMDSKINFTKRMGTSIYTPESYLHYNEIKNENDEYSLYFVKKDGSTGSQGVNVYYFKDLSNVNTENCIIQKSMKNPDLYQNKRYKMRVHVILHNKEVYYCKNHFATVSGINYNIDTKKDLRNINVIHQTENTLFIFSNLIDRYELIEKNIILAIEDFKKFYLKEIENILDKEFVILGFDFVVDSEKNVHNIEINHRSNYAHPDEISKKTDVLCMRDLIKLLINGTHENTDLLLIN
mgnify:CR=1 FL=1